MFAGTMPGPIRAIIKEHSDRWRGTSIYVPCSTDLSVERVLARAPQQFRLHSCEFLVVTAAIGALLAHRVTGFPDDEARFHVTIRDEYAEEFGWMEPWLTDPLDTTASIMLASRMMQGAGSVTDGGDYYVAVRAEYRDQWETLHAKTKAKLTSIELPIHHFHLGNPADFVEAAPADAVIIAFPPLPRASGQFAHVDRVFDWPAPDYRKLTAEDSRALVDQIAQRDQWMIGTLEPVPGLDAQLVGRVQTHNRQPVRYVYATTPGKRVVAPKQAIQACRTPRLEPGMTIGDHMWVAEIPLPVFYGLRSAYLNHNIPPGRTAVAHAVMVDDRMVGVLGWQTGASFSQWDKKLPGPQAYLLSDFPVAGSDYPKLSKLIVMAALSTEMKALLERKKSQRYRAVVTTAFSKRPVSMKYRGLLTLIDRKERKPKDGVDLDDLVGAARFLAAGFDLNYGGLAGQWSCDEALAKWKSDFGERKPHVD